jgi:hypothetical protein
MLGWQVNTSIENWSDTINDALLIHRTKIEKNAEELMKQQAHIKAMEKDIKFYKIVGFISIFTVGVAAIAACVGVLL